MNELLNSDSKSDKELYLAYLIPTFIAVFIKATLMSIDTVFIGQGIGPLGLAAVGMTMPVNAVFSSISVFIGIGGAALMSIQFGKNHFPKGQAIFEQSLFFLFLISFLAALAIFIFNGEIANTLGADGELNLLIKDYLAFMALFYVGHSIVLLLTFFTMNDGNPKLPMYSMIVGIVVCLVADYLLIFVFEMGIKGAAIASVLTQFAMISVLISHFILRKGALTLNRVVVKFNHIPSIFKTGIPALLIELSATVTISVFNYILINEYSESHVAAFSLIINLTVIVLLVFGGISQASQPLFSYSLGHNQFERIKGVLKLVACSTAALGVLLFALGYWAANSIVDFYVQGEKEFLDIAVIAVSLFALSIPFIGFNLAISSFLQAVKSTILASSISVLRGFVFLLLGLFLVTNLGIENGIWKVTLFAEAITFVFSIYFLFFYLRKTNRLHN
ncbi:MATE family efflux transporter [Pseudoalteromonas peptidolytica]|uniref:MATE family efflux transporter n=1 Tax=Pseudoalteromonas peptidolytica TaxID=61150 RepID=UPI00298E2E59|nr:MATE family efflux transporter [Pseudoalteromonas peptidolytica]MDW7548751.1 MATE family efflux transporter [Pseudoalteromonas peptidolytica]